MNLLQNAFDALAQTPEPMVWVDMGCTGEADPPTVRVTVRDNGPGIPAEHLLRIFDPFFTTKPVGKGTGLGLSISYGIVEQHGGHLGARNAEGGGAAFILELPRA
jgi:two-component system, NtrC family, sensor histidine kinase HupT/HoxJ